MKPHSIRCLLVIALLVGSTVSAEAQRRRIFSSRKSRSSTNSKHEKLKKQADSAYSSGEYERTIALATKVINENFRDHVALYLRASARCELGAYRGDAKLIRDGIADTRESLQYSSKNNLYYIPYIYEITKMEGMEGKKKHAEVALDVANQTLDIVSLSREEKTHLLFQRGGALMALERHRDAAADYDAAIRLDVKLISAYIGLSEAYTADKKADKARKSYDRMVDAFPDSALVYDYRGVFLQQQDKPNDAIADFTRAIELDASYYSAYTNRGYTLLQTGQHKAADADFSASLRIVPNQPMAYSLRGSARLSQGQIDDAIEDHFQVVTLMPDNPGAHAELGFALYFGGDYSQALTAFEKAQSIDAGMRHLDMWRYLLLTLSGRSKNVQKLTKPALAKDAKDRDWVDHVLAYQGGGSSDEELLKSVGKTDSAGASAQLCEAHFFIGMKKKIAGDNQSADAHLKKALATQATRLSAFRAAQFALGKITKAG